MRIADDIIREMKTGSAGPAGDAGEARTGGAGNAGEAWTGLSGDAAGSGNPAWNNGAGDAGRTPGSASAGNGERSLWEHGPACKEQFARAGAEERKAEEQLERVAGALPKAEKEDKTILDRGAGGPEEEEDRKAPLLENPEDPDALSRMIRTTPARIGVGKAGPRLRTKTLIKLRADHAAARDAVLMDVSEGLIERLGLFPVVTKCSDKNEFLTRPDLGRDFPEETQRKIAESCAKAPDIQIIVSDGLSSTAIEANAERILPVVMEGLKEKHLTVGTPIFVKYGRVAAQDRISELTGAKIVCSFIGERPGLATAESMSAYISYKATVGMPEARRTVVSNIHKNGVPAVEAGAYIVDLLALMLEKQASGVDLRK